MNFRRFLLPLRACPAAPFCLFFAVTVLAQEDVNHTRQVGREELQAVLLQARDAVIRLAAKDDSSLDTSIADKVAQLVKSFLSVDDRDDVRYLQQHLKKAYADRIRTSSEPPAAISELKQLIVQTERENDPIARDQELGAIVEQQIKLGLLEDAAINAAKIKVPTSRVTLFASIALAQHKASNDTAAEKAVDAATKACLEPPPTVYISPADMQLERLATFLAQKEYGAGARRALASAKEAVISKKRPNGYDWENYADAAIDIGDLDAATQVLPKVEAGELRTAEAERIIAAEARKADPGDGVTLAMRIQAPDRRAKVLCDIARKQASSGNGRAAASTIEVALEAAAQSSEFRVFTLNDIAWAQIEIDDQEGAERTLQMALLDNEKQRYGSDQVQGWGVVADTEAFLGHFERAHEIANKINDHYFRGRALGFIAEREVEAGHSDEALAWAKRLKDPNERAAAYVSIAGKMVEDLQQKSK